MSLQLRAYTRAAACANPPLGYDLPFPSFASRATMATSTGCARCSLDDFLRLRVLLSLFLPLPLYFPACSYSCDFSLFSFFSVVDRSGKDPPRVALHEGVVDEESIKLALRQHYLAGYRCLGCLVISSVSRPSYGLSRPRAATEN